ncbi:MAG: CBS domain-containing protein [Pseudoxanthomonas sp.]
MQKISEVMTRDVRSISPEETVRRAAQLMDELNVGSLPVCDGPKLVGMITDRDITIRSTAAGQAPESTRVGDVMSTQVRTCHESQSVDEVLKEMGDSQIRRVPVVDQASHTLVGIVSLGDFATRHAGPTDEALEEISAPSEGSRAKLN